jgi:HSP20 family protein
MEDDEKEWRRRIRRFMPGPWNLADIDKMIEEMEKFFAEQFKDIEKIMPRALVREKVLPDGTRKREIGPIVYGYSITIGPDGKPVIREFGNFRRTGGSEGQIKEEREPLVDVVTTENDVRVIAEIPGVQKQDISLTLEENRLIISVETENRKYYKEVDLPENIEAEKAKSRYNNGILEVTVPIKGRGSTKSVRIKVD